MAWQLDIAVEAKEGRGRGATGAFMAGFMAGEIEAGRRATTLAVEANVNRLKNGIRAEVRRGGLGDRLANAVRGEVYPDPKQAFSFDAKGRVFSKALVKRRTGPYFDLILEYAADQNIVAKDGRRFLAIPTKNTPRLTGRRRTLPEDFPAGFLRFVKVGTAGSFVEGARGGALLIGKDDRVYFVLVRRTHLSQRLDLRRFVDDPAAGLDSDIVARWERSRAGSVPSTLARRTSTFGPVRRVA